VTFALQADTAHSVRCAETGRRWPAPDGIPFLRTWRDALAEEALMRLDREDREGALVLLLADQDDWWRGDVADPEALRTLVRGRDRLSLRQAMALLSWGPVGDYFAHRWSDPVFLAGLALVEAHWNAPRTAFELACGIGHHLRALAEQGVAVTGADLVFAKLWIARHWLLPRDAALLCLDAAQAWPIAARFDLVACHDALYFLEPKAAILEGLRTLLAPGRGVLAVGHVHNRDSRHFSAGSALTAAEMAGLFPEALLYDDAELTVALAAARPPVPADAAELRDAEAFAAVEGPGLSRPKTASGWLGLPMEGGTLRRNPLYGEDGRIAWPSRRYAAEYAPRVTFPLDCAVPRHAVLETATRDAARRRELLALPERW
jgi:hypothetical protein